MKILKYSLITLFGILLIGGISCYFWLNSSKPTYEGTFPIPGLKDSVDVRFDNFGVPHIEAQNMHDLYMAFGYVHAQDRLFQMELLRRAGSGRLSEVLGKKLLKADVLLRTIGLSAYADSSAAWMEQHKDSPMYAEMLAYLEGVNAFLHNGPTPPEFSIIGIEKVDFTIRDMFCITGAMAFSFSQAQKTDPIMDLIHKKYGNEYLADIGLWHDSTETFIRDFRPSIDSLKPNVPKPTGIAQDYSSLSNLFAEIEAAIPYAPLEGSNSWVISPKKTTSGNVLFCNDTHIGYLLPQTWYEAHLKCNSFEMYGHYMAGIPFALVGRNEKLSWGVTMLLNDDMDFYREFPNPENPHQFKFGEGFEDCSIRKELIKIKSEEDTLLNVLVTRHGPIISGIFDGVKKEDPLSMLWTYTRCKNNTMLALYGMNNSDNMEDFSENLPNIHGPGLSVNYGDNKGNIAWWACASLLERPDSINSWTVLDGTDPRNEPLGYYDFEENPRCINPEWGYIYSANDWPAQVDGKWYPGYYKPQYRADRIRKLLGASDDFNLDNIKDVMNDVTNETDKKIMLDWGIELGKWKAFDTSTYVLTVPLFTTWDGAYELNSTSPTLFNKMIYHVMKDACADEMGRENFEVFSTTHQFQRALEKLCSNHLSPWWDNVNTPEIEIYADILRGAFAKSFAELTDQLGTNPKVWYWSKVCSLELRHPLGEVALFRPFFNVGPEPERGGNETILQSGFKHDSTGFYKVYFGSQMRILVDFAHPDSALNVTPSGQSGHIMSPHYKDQWDLYRKGEFRVQWMNSDKIRTFRRLQLIPG